MNKKTVELVIFLVSVIIKYGTPTVKNFIRDLDKDTITKQDIIDLMIEQEPESFFK